MIKSILLSFDLEEFDLPKEYGIKISDNEMFDFSLGGLKKLLSLLEKYKIKVTFFVTGGFASKFPKIIRQISLTHEIASHGFKHSTKKYIGREVSSSKLLLEKIISKKIKGFRAQRLYPVDLSSLKKLKFAYDSSICPSYLPRRYNNFFYPSKITIKKGIYEVPISVSPLLHLPLSWIFIRNFGIHYAKLITRSSLKSHGFVNLYFHPWEFNSLKSYNIPSYIQHNSGEKALVLLAEYISWCKKNNYEFQTFSEHLGI
jgi:hypothetical protein